MCSNVHDKGKDESQKGEDICKSDLRSIPRTYEELLQLNSKNTKNPMKKMGKASKQTFLQRRNTNCKKAHEKILKIISH